MRAVIALALLVGLLGPAWAAETPIPPAPARWVTDQAGLLSPATRARLDARLERYQQATGRQVIVWIGRTLGDAPIDDWAAKAFSAWGIGQRGKDNGVAIFVFPQDRKLRIEVGYGLEDVLPDAYASRIVREVMTPALQAGRSDAAIWHGVDQVLSRLGDEPNAVPVAPLPAQRRGLSPFAIVLGGIALIGFLILLATHPTLALWLLWSLISGGRGGGIGGGGFSGGGGRSGGGGASGSW
jgi:uncharacterized protein